MRCGLLGRKLSHSYSPQIHSHLGNYSYELFEKEPEDLESFLNSNSFDGVNVTIPYKKAVIPFCSKLSPEARAMGAVNTIIRTEEGELIGHNTDLYGFRSMLIRSGLQLCGKKVLVLGSGGASATAVYVAREEGAHVVVISRSGENNYSNLHLHRDAAVIINATPVGMFPNNGESPVDLTFFPTLEGVLDMIYNPSRTELLMQAQQRGLVAENGLWMLIAQAKESAEWFSGTQIDCTKVAGIYTKMRMQMENIILVGMPGCGKSSIGKALAQKTERTFVDADSEIESYAQMTIPQIFSVYGEEGFRTIETKVLDNLGRQSNLVIATGGGCVTRPENYKLLHQNGSIIWIKRDLNLLPTEGRPLSQIQSLENMHLQRRELYAQFSDISLNNDKDIDAVVDKIIFELRRQA